MTVLRGQKKSGATPVLKRCGRAFAADRSIPCREAPLLRALLEAGKITRTCASIRNPVCLVA